MVSRFIGLLLQEILIWICYLIKFSNLIQTKVHHEQITCFRHFKIIDYLSIKRHKAKPHIQNTNYKKKR